MQKNKIILAKKTLSLLENYKFDKISMSRIIGSQKIISIKNKNDLIININKYFDYLLTKRMNTIEKSSTKDMLFETFMERLDILNTHRKSIKNLLLYFRSYPHTLVKLIPSFLDTIILMATFSNVEIKGIKGMVKIKSMFILYILIIYTWNNDETDSLEKTMTVLDKYLTNIDKLARLFNE